MTVLSIKASNLRNLKTPALTFNSGLNVFFGVNGSGKTSLLEAIYILSTARSFRTRKVSNIVTRQSIDQNLVVFGQMLSKTGEQFSIGVRKSIDQGTEIKIGSISERSASKLACITPTLLIEPNSFRLLDGSPSERRKFIDWGVFHVEHHFSKYWNDYLHCLKQRNMLLRHRNLDIQQLEIWDQQLSEYGELISTCRQNYFVLYELEFTSVLREIAPELFGEIKLEYKRGWDTSRSLLDVLVSSRDKDSVTKYTQYGSQRADIKITYKGKPAIEMLSRGQQKKLIVALYLSHIQVLKQKSQYSSVVLFDDITAELDEINATTVVQFLLKLDAQVFCTLLEKDKLQNILKNDVESYTVFHVEHGVITKKDTEDF